MSNRKIMLAGLFLIAACCAFAQSVYNMTPAQAKERSESLQNLGKDKNGGDNAVMEAVKRNFEAFRITIEKPSANKNSYLMRYEDFLKIKAAQEKAVKENNLKKPVITADALQKRIIGDVAALRESVENAWGRDAFKKRQLEGPLTVNSAEYKAFKISEEVRKYFLNFEYEVKDNGLTEDKKELGKIAASLKELSRAVTRNEYLKFAELFEVFKEENLLKL